MQISPTTLAALAGILAFLTAALPIIQAILQKPWWPEHWKRGIQLGLSVVTGLVAYAATTGFSFRTLPELVLWILGALAAANIGYAGPLGGIAKAVEQATTKAPYTDAEVEAEIDLDQVERDSGTEPTVPLPDNWRDDPSLNPTGAATEVEAEGRHGV